MSGYSADVSEYIKIRRHVMTLILRAGNKRMLLPSIQELANQFSVSRPTVCKAMKTLTEQGFVIGKRGIGSFTNPEKRSIIFDNSDQFSRLPIIGLLLGDGMLVHYDYYYAQILAELLKATAKLPAIIHLVPINSSELDNICRTFENEQLDGLICYQPSAKIFQAAQQMSVRGLPVVVGEYPGEFSPSVSLDYEKFGYECGMELLAEGRYNIAYCLNRPPWNIPLNGLRRAFSEAGRKLNENLLFQDPSSYLDDLRKLVRFGSPLDAVYCTYSDACSIGCLLEKENPFIWKSCLLVESAFASPPATPFRRILYNVPFEHYCTELVSCLKHRMGKESVGSAKIPLIMTRANFKKTR